MTLTDKLEKKITAKMESKWMPKFQKQSRYLGQGVYSIPATNLFSTCTRELFLMFCACQEGIKFETDKNYQLEE